MFIKCKTDRGKKRTNNEDYVLSLKCSKYTLLIVADGMGGHNAGEIASKMAAITIRDFVFNNFEKYNDKEELIRDAIVESNNRVYHEQISNEKCKGMGTTTTCCVLMGDTLFVGHVGDSRAYIINKNEIRKLTEDHSFVQELINNGSITEDEAFNHPQSNIITRSIGPEEFVVVDTRIEKLNKEDIILLCSDGLTSYINNHEIWEIVNSRRESSVEELIRMANDRGGRDNISVIIVGEEEIQ